MQIDKLTTGTSVRLLYFVLPINREGRHTISNSQKVKRHPGQTYRSLFGGGGGVDKTKGSNQEKSLKVSYFFFEIYSRPPSPGADPGYVKRGGRDPKGGAGWLI